MTRRSPWGSVRRLPSGRFQARYRVGGVEHLAPQTFPTMREAQAFLAATRTAGVRTVSIPAVLIAELEEHLAQWAAPGFEGFVFPGTKDQPFRRASLYTAWRRAARTVGVDELHFHDLRHTGATLAATTGATTKELMARMGHASPRAALIYQHATTRGRDFVSRRECGCRSLCGARSDRICLPSTSANQADLAREACSVTHVRRAGLRGTDCRW